MGDIMEVEKVSLGDLVINFERKNNTWRDITHIIPLRVPKNTLMFFFRFLNTKNKLSELQ